MLRPADRVDLGRLVGPRIRVVLPVRVARVGGLDESELRRLPFTLIEVTFMSGPAVLFADRRSKSRLKLVRHWVARSVSTTWLPARNWLLVAS